MNVIIANKLVALRKQNNYSQEDLAERLGISRQAISKWERAESSPDTDNLISLAKLYNISLDELLLSDDSSSIEYERGFNSRQAGNQFSNAGAEILEKPPAMPREIYVEVQDKEREDNVGVSQRNIWNDFPFAAAITFVYVFIGFAFDWWHPGWMLYMLVPFYHWAAENFLRK